MKLYHSILSVALVLVGCVVSRSAQSDPPPSTRTITVTVTVEAPAGTPVEGISVGLVRSRPSAVGKTDAQGKVVLTGVFPEGMAKVFATLVRQSTQLLEQGSATCSVQNPPFDRGVATP